MKCRIAEVRLLVLLVPLGIVRGIGTQLLIMGGIGADTDRGNCGSHIERHQSHPSVADSEEGIRFHACLDRGLVPALVVRENLKYLMTETIRIHPHCLRML